MAEHEERYGGGTRVRKEAKKQIKGHEGSYAPLVLQSGRELIAIIPARHSEAAKTGNDVFFQVCSVQCANDLAEAVKSDLGRVEGAQ